MPLSPLRPCTRQGCPSLVRGGGACPSCRRKYELNRGSRHERGYNYAWMMARAKYLEENPVCQCGKPATVVDHIVPHRGNRELFWDRTNWQPLCARCHSSKTVLHDGGMGRSTTAPATQDVRGRFVPQESTKREPEPAEIGPRIR